MHKADILALELKKTFDLAVGKIFEDGVESTFSFSLHSLIVRFGEKAVRGIDMILRYENIEVAVETLRQLGTVEHIPTHAVRLSLLIYNLKSSDPRIRDAASLGIANMDDSIVINDIREAVEDENIPTLKKSLEVILAQLLITKEGT